MKTMYWSLKLFNYHGSKTEQIIYFDNYDIAKKNFKALCKIGLDCNDFVAEEYLCSWSDPDYDNEYLTCITLGYRPLPMIHKNVIF